MTLLTDTQTEFDPFRLEVLWTRAVAIADEMAATLIRTAFSTIIRVNYDFACGVFDDQGDLLAQATNCAPGQLGCMPSVMKDALQVYPAHTLAPGDVLITNDPWIGSGHSSDVFVASPVFMDDRLVGFACNAAHHMDVGGTLRADTRDVHEEGLLIPVSKLYSAGEENDMLVRLLKLNVRYPDKTVGDLRAQLAANYVGGERLAQLIDDNGLEDLRGLTGAVSLRTEEAMQSALETVPSGTYRCHYPLEELDRSGGGLHIDLALTIDDGRAIVDFTGTSPQVDRPINSVLNYTRSYSLMGLKMALCPDLPYNGGIQRPVEIVVPEANLLNAEYPIAVWWRTAIGQLLPEVIFMALAQAVPERVIAGCGSVPMWLYFFRGRQADGTPYYEGSNAMGGLGARYGKDGLSTVAFPMNMAAAPSEVIERETRSVLVERRELTTDSGGAGRHRGGLGQRVCISVLPTSTWPLLFTVSRGRYSAGPVGLLGGGDGGRGAVRVNGELLPFTDIDTELNAGDRVELELPGGGGMHPPFERDPTAVEHDVRRGYVSPAAARTTYGVALDPTTHEASAEATEELRRSAAPGAGERSDRA